MKALSKKIILILTVIVSTQISSVQAREPGVGPGFPPGLTHGIPTGALPPPGVYVLQRFNYSSGDVVDDDGNDIGVEVNAFVESTQINWSTDWTLFGARYMTFFAVPYMVDLDTKTPGPKFSNSGLLNPVWKHLLSWDLGEGLFAAVGFANYFMIGDDDVAPQFDYLFEPEVQVSYLSKDWNLTAQAVFTINGENDDTDYESGDNILLNAHALRNFGKFSVGPIINYHDQLNSDQNNGTFFGGVAAEDASALAVGGLISYNYGPAMVRLYATENIHSRNTVDETNIWAHIEFKLW